MNKLIVFALIAIFSSLDLRAAPANDNQPPKYLTYLGPHFVNPRPLPLIMTPAEWQLRSLTGTYVSKLPGRYAYKDLLVISFNDASRWVGEANDTRILDIQLYRNGIEQAEAPPRPLGLIKPDLQGVGRGSSPVPDFFKPGTNRLGSFTETNFKKEDSVLTLSTRQTILLTTQENLLSKFLSGERRNVTEQVLSHDGLTGELILEIKTREEYAHVARGGAWRELKPARVRRIAFRKISNQLVDFESLIAAEVAYKAKIGCESALNGL